MAGLMAPVGEDGKLQTHTDQSDSLTQKSKKDNSVIDSDMFLTLLVAEMQNQDPLEPTSNTEWVSQYATFTQVQKMSEMAESVDMLRANDLVGKNVIMKVTSASTGDVTYKEGVVEYTMIENGKSILVIDGEKYSLSDLDSVISTEYSEAYEMYEEFAAEIAKLPGIKYADTSYADTIQSLYDKYNAMNSYQQNFMNTYGAEEMQTLADWMNQLSKLGIKFAKNVNQEGPTSKDFYNMFYSKMNAILDKLNALSPDSDSSKDDSSNKTEKA